MVVPVWKRTNVVGQRAVNGLNVVGYGWSRPEKFWTVPSLFGSYNFALEKELFSDCLALIFSVVK